MKHEHLNEIKGIVILALSLIVLASLVSFTANDLAWFTSAPNPRPHNWIGIAGAYSAGVLYFILGLSAYFFVVIGFFLSWNKFTSRELPFSFPKFLSVLILFSVIASLFALVTPAGEAARFTRAGIVGIVVCDTLLKYFSPLGAFLILMTFGALALIVVGEFLVSPFFVWLAGLIVKTFHKLTGVAIKGLPLPNKSAAATARTNIKNDEQQRPETKNISKPVKEQVAVVAMPKPAVVAKPEAKAEVKPEVKPTANVPAVASTPNIHIVKTKEQPVTAPQAPKIVGEYHLPDLDLLNDPPQVSDSKIQDTLMNGAKMLEETLNDFGVNVKVADIERGPVITRYELQPAPGVKVGRIVALADDIALVLSVPAVRVVAPIPGKNRVGIEVPNGSSAAVFLKDLLKQTQNRNSSKLTLAIGKDISGKPLIADLAEMPHLLVAGTTGSGKSVCLNSIIMSILFNASPSEVKFIMVDPKMVEMLAYNDLPHLICPVITDAKKATAAFNWVVGEMESRYKQLAAQGVKNIRAFHAKGLDMPYIVVVVDELADLMQVSAKSVEGSIMRLAQMARAVGIHLIVATQRPSVNVITGVIKANFPARISFKVASQMDSRTILDEGGAEDLLGKGDLLFMKPGEAKPTRGQCCYVSDEEINTAIAFIKKQANPEYNDGVLKPQVSTAGSGSDEKDDMYDEAVRVVIETNQASVTILQRRLRLGYSRAARLIDMMEQHGIVGPYAGSKARDILVDREKWLLDNMAPKQASGVPSNEQQSTS